MMILFHKNYTKKKTAYPILDSFDISDSVRVEFKFSVIQLLDVDEKSQTIKTVIWRSYVSFHIVLEYTLFPIWL